MTGLPTPQPFWEQYGNFQNYIAFVDYSLFLLENANDPTLAEFIWAELAVWKIQADRQF